MKKETIIAIILGIVAGISIAGIVIVNSRNSSRASGDVILDGVSPTVAVSRDESSPLLITEPDNESVIEKSALTLKGSAQKDALIVIQSPTPEYVFENENHDFSQKMDLLPGENVIRISSYNKKNVDSRTLTVYSIPPSN